MKVQRAETDVILARLRKIHKNEVLKYEYNILIGDVMKLYEVVCTSGYLDIGLCIEKDENLNPIKVLARAHTYGMSEYGGVESVSWIKTGVYLIKDDWKSISYNKSTDQILQKLKILKIIKTEEEIKEDNNMTTVRDVVDNRAYNKKYNIEWYLDNGQVQTTSAVMTSIENGYLYFKYPSGGIFIIRDCAIRSLQCLEV